MESSIKIDSFVWAVMDKHKETCRDTDTHTLGSIATYSVKITEYKNELGNF